MFGHIAAIMCAVDAARPSEMGAFFMHSRSAIADNNNNNNNNNQKSISVKLKINSPYMR